MADWARECRVAAQPRAAVSLIDAAGVETGTGARRRKQERERQEEHDEAYGSICARGCA